MRNLECLISRLTLLPAIDYVHDLPTEPGSTERHFHNSQIDWPRETIVAPKGEIAAFCDSTGRWLPLLCTMNVTVATEMLRNDFG